MEQSRRRNERLHTVRTQKGNVIGAVRLERENRGIERNALTQKD